MEAVANKFLWRSPTIVWEAIAPVCSWHACRRGRTRWQTLLRRQEGVRFGSDWFCGVDCLQDFLLLKLHRHFLEPCSESAASSHRIPLGLILLSRGIVDHESLQQALVLQKSEGGRVGDCLRRLCDVTEEQITSALAKQWSCPVYPSSRSSECRHMFPRQLQEFHRMLPVHFVEASRDLYVAFEQRIDYTALLALEQMLNCHTRPCVLPETELRRRLAEEQFMAGNTEIVFASTITPHELARSVCGYVQQTGAERVRMLGCGPHLWIRLDSDQRSLDLLVRRWQP